METIIAKITGDPEQDNIIIAKAANIIKNGGLVAFPTETVYGLGGDGLNPQASAKIYEAKGRPSDNPLIVHISKVEDLAALSDNIPDAAYKLADAFWPGPLTMIIPKNEAVPYGTTGGLETVAVRLPSHPIAKALIAQSGTYIAAPSANISGRPSPTDGKHVIEDLAGRIDMIIDNGSIDIGVESTIVDLTETVPVILRPGYVTKKMLEEVLGSVQIDPTLLTGVTQEQRPKAPGMKYRHYAPKAELTIVQGQKSSVVKKINQLAEAAIGENKKVGIMTSSEDAGEYIYGEVINLGSNIHSEEIARHLFATLREFDLKNVDVIFSEAFSEEGIGQAVMNRLLKAAGHKIIKV